jgi:signal peptidase I
MAVANDHGADVLWGRVLRLRGVVRDVERHHRVSDASTDVVDPEHLADSEADPPVAERARSSWLLRLGLGLIAVLLVMRLFVAQPVLTDGHSMEPTLHDGDALVIDRVTYRFRDPAIGDIVMAVTPDTRESVVKRVVAVGGDSIGIEDGVLIRNGRPVDEPYADQTQMGGYYWGPVDVPDGHVFLLGDNRLESVDSRRYGTVPVDDVEGRYAFRVWPF